MTQRTGPGGSGSLSRRLRAAGRKSPVASPVPGNSATDTGEVPLPHGIRSALLAVPLLETLESRQMLDGITQSSYQLTLTGDDWRSNTFDVRVVGRDIVTTVNNKTQYFGNVPQVTVVIVGGNMADTVNVSDNVYQTAAISTKGGDDSIRGGSNNDTIDAGDGNDRIDGGHGWDSARNGETLINVEVNSGGGTTTPTVPTPAPAPAPAPTPPTGNLPSATARIDNGNLRITAPSNQANTIKVTLDAATQKLLVQCNVDVASFNLVDVKWVMIDGGNAADLIEVDAAVPRPTSVNGGNGNDTIRTANGNDVVWGGAGNDLIDGRNGAGWLAGADGNDTIAGGNSSDTLMGGDGDDLLDGGAGYDLIAGEGGWDIGVNGEVNQSIESTSTVSAPTPTPSPTPPPAPTPAPTPPPPTGATGAGLPPAVGWAGNPVARMTSVSGYSITAGQAVQVDGLSSTLNAGQATTARYEWDFGDHGAKHNKLVGFNASHVYDHPGTYTITLRVVNEGGKTSTVTQQVNVAADSRPAIYVSWSGSDANPGTIDRPVRTLARAADVLGRGSNMKVLFKRGESFDVSTRELWIYGSNVTVGAYGGGANPVLRYTGPRDKRRFMIVTDMTARNVTVENLTFDSMYTAADGDQANMPTSVLIYGTNVAVRNNTFLDVGFAMNVTASANGVHSQDNTAPKTTGIRDYFMWIAGQNVVAVGNQAANSTREHVIRISGGQRVLIAGNDLTNLDRQSVDRLDAAKGVITAQRGSYMYLANNRLNGPSGFGPLGKADGLNETWGRTSYGVFDSNFQTGGAFELRHGAEHVMLRNNIFDRDNSVAIQVDGFDHSYQRGVIDATIVNNTAVNDGTTGNFLHMVVPVEGIRLLNNLYVAPNLVSGAYGAAPVAVQGSSLSSFTQIDSNIWGNPATMNFLNNGVMWVGSGLVAGDFRTPTQWNNTWPVGTDYFTKVNVDWQYRPYAGQANVNAATVTGGVFTDYYGNYRPAGGWSVGAVQAA